MRNGKTIIISDDKRDLFRIHFYEEYIKFDAKFSEAITQDEAICDKVIEINREWAEKKLEVVDVLEKFAILVDLNKEKFEGYYFQDYELNRDGKYVDLVPLDSMMINADKKAHDFYKYLLSENVLISIDKKEFESEIKDESYKEIYIEVYKSIYKRKKLYFYKYNLNDNFERKTCCFVATSKEFLFGYVF